MSIRYWFPSDTDGLPSVPLPIEDDGSTFTVGVMKSFSVMALASSIAAQTTLAATLPIANGWQHDDRVVVVPLPIDDFPLPIYLRTAVDTWQDGMDPQRIAASLPYARPWMHDDKNVTPPLFTDGDFQSVSEYELRSAQRALLVAQRTATLAASLPLGWQWQGDERAPIVIDDDYGWQPPPPIQWLPEQPVTDDGNWVPQPGQSANAPAVPVIITRTARVRYWFSDDELPTPLVAVADDDSGWWPPPVARALPPPLAVLDDDQFTPVVDDTDAIWVPLTVPVAGRSIAAFVEADDFAPATPTLVPADDGYWPRPLARVPSVAAFTADEQSVPIAAPLLLDDGAVWLVLVAPPRVPIPVAFLADDVLPQFVAGPAATTTLLAAFTPLLSLAEIALATPPVTLALVAPPSTLSLVTTSP